MQKSADRNSQHYEWLDSVPPTGLGAVCCEDFDLCLESSYCIQDQLSAFPFPPNPPGMSLDTVFGTLPMQHPTDWQLSLFDSPPCSCPEPLQPLSVDAAVPTKAPLIGNVEESDHLANTGAQSGLTIHRARTCHQTSDWKRSFRPKVKKTKKFALIKRVISKNDARLKQNQTEKPKESVVRHIPQVASSLFFQHNEALVPPYQVIVDTNFINFSIQNKLEMVKAMMDCLYAKCIPCITDCVMAELEKMGEKYRIALRVARDPRFERLPCSHKGTYADDCIVNRIMQHRCYIVATCDRDLKRRIRKVPGVPIMYISSRKYAIERLPEAPLL
ncbi:hypothetical protein HDU91_002497 [Kappamyces sp. JEL0680]|nr:hypothetical protein HDU91_002497 [Kappamyces sp. JEL0680]